ncbi:MAG: tetratricopeptide repeat protein, partial [Acidobacteriales bacterium]|nr:tetratricopeptide repeat protein [Terriglobales bacterium]
MRKFQHAQQLQKLGNHAAAIREYSQVLARLPDEKPQLISLVTLHIAECQWALGEPAAALVSLDKALAADPENRVARLRRAEFTLIAGSPPAAIDAAQWVLAREPDNLEALTVLGGANAVLGQIALARSIFERVLAIDPGHPEAALTLAQIYAGLGETDKARKVLLQATHHRSSAPEPWLGLARLEEETGNTLAAEEHYRKAVALTSDRQAKLRLAEFLARSSRIPEAEQILAELHAESRRTSTVRGDFELLLGHASDAIAEYTSFLNPRSGNAEDPGHDAHSFPQPALTRASVIVRLIEAELTSAHKQAQRNSALARAKALLDQYKAELDESTTESLQAELALVAGDLPQAEIHAARAVTLAPRSAAANFVAGLVKREARDLPAANAFWNAALERDREFLPARQAVAEQALTAGDAAAAEEYIVQVVRREPANFDGLCIYARALAAQRKTAAASLIAHRALAADKASAEPHLILGNIAMQEKRWGLAFVEYQQAILLDPDSGRAMSALAQVYRKGRITRPMLQQMERVAGNAPASASLMEIVGRLYADRGWHGDAERALRKAAAIDPTRATAATALALAYLRDGKQRAAANSLAMTGEGMAQLIAGQRANEDQDLFSAIRSYESAVRGGERTGTAANNLAWLYARQGIALDRALQLAQFARGLAPHDPAVLDTLGFVQLRRREYSQAVQSLKQAIELAASPAGKPVAPEALYQMKLHLAEAYELSG